MSEPETWELEERVTQLEYKEVGANLRQYSSMRFAQMTLFLGLTAALVSVITKSGPTLSWSGIVVGSGGAIVASVFWVMEERVADYWHHFARRATQLEKQLGCRQYAERPDKRYITAGNAVRTLYGVVLIFWLWFSSASFVSASYRSFGMEFACLAALLTVVPTISLTLVVIVIWLNLIVQYARTS